MLNSKANTWMATVHGDFCPVQSLGQLSAEENVGELTLAVCKPPAVTFLTHEVFLAQTADLVRC
jgi:hypothetical protein